MPQAMLSRIVAVLAALGALASAAIGGDFIWP